MKALCSPIVPIVVLLVAGSDVRAQAPVGTAFTYQGRLNSSGQPYTGSADMQFTLYDAAAGGHIVAGPYASGNVQVKDGLFTTTVDFGAEAFNGEARWLQIGVVTPAGGGDYIPLSPRQAIQPTPYALKVPGIDGHSLNAADGDPIDALFVNSDGYVGIGTTSPLYALHVETTADRAIYGRTQGTLGAYGISDNPNGCGVRGDATSASGWAAGGVFNCWSSTPGASGVTGTAWAATGPTYGGAFESHSDKGYGVYGRARAPSGFTCGGYFESDSPFGIGVHGTGYWGGSFVSEAPIGGVGTGGSCRGGGEVGVGVYGHSDNTFGGGVMGCGDGPHTDGVVGLTNDGFGVEGIALLDGGIAGYFESREGNTAPALQTLGDALVQGRDWPGAGVESRLLLGDGNHYIKSVAGQGVRIGTYGAADLVRLQEGSGLVGIGRTPTAHKLEVEGNASKTAGSGAWEINSDARIKTDVRTVTHALDTLDRVRLVRFRYTDEYRCEHPVLADREYLNVIAQEFAEVFPDYVQASGEKLPDGSEILQVDPYPLTIYTAAAVQELHEQLKEKDAQIAELSSRLEKLETMMARLAERQDGGER